MADIKELEAKVKTLTEANDALTEGNKALTEVNTELTNKVAELEKQIASAPAPVVTVPGKSFEVDKVEYVFTAPKFKHNNNVITAEQALADEKLLKELVEIGFGGIKPKNA